MSFPERLKTLRQGQNLSQIALAKKLNVSSRNYQRYEYGEIEAPMSIGVSLADFFNVSLDYLVGRSDNPEINR